MTETTHTGKPMHGHHGFPKAGSNISWAAIIAGTVSFFAVMVLFSLISSAIGFAVITPTSDDPLGGAGIGVLIWTIISLVVSLFVGGFVAGLASGRTGLLHGFLTWALSLVLALVLMLSAAAGIVGTAGNILGSVLGFTGSTASSAAEAVGSVVSDATDAGLSALSDELSSVDTDQLQADVKKVLSDTEIKELQPEYLSSMLDEVKDLIVSNSKAVLTGQKDLDSAIDEISSDLESKIDTLSNAADRDAIANAVAKNTELSSTEAEQAVDNIYNELKTAADTAKSQLEELKSKLADLAEQAQTTVEQGVQEAREVAETATNVTAGISVGMFFALAAGLVLSSWAGYLGSHAVSRKRVAQN